MIGRLIKSGLSVILGLCTAFLCACTQPDVSEKETVTFSDDLGRTVTVEKNPIRVAALIGSFAEVWMLAGGEVCAAADDAWDDFGLELSADAVNLGGTKSPSLEKLLSAEPDFVIASTSTAKNLEWKEILEEAGIPVAFFDVSCFSDYLRMLDICTDITGRKDLYEQNGKTIEKRIEALKADYFSKTEEVPPTVLFLRASSGYIRAKNSKDSVLGEMLAELGCLNIADRDGSFLEDLNLESILESDPYYIFIVQVGDDADAVRESVANMMEENPAWQQLSAVKEGRVRFLDKRLFHLKPNARWADAYEALIGILQE